MSDIKERLADMSVLSQSRTPADALKYIQELEAENTDLAARALEAEDELAKAVKIAQKAIEQLRSYGKN